jgi:hypothetical protein
VKNQQHFRGQRPIPNGQQALDDRFIIQPFDFPIVGTVPSSAFAARSFKAAILARENPRLMIRQCHEDVGRTRKATAGEQRDEALEDARGSLVVKLLIGNCSY